MNPESKTVQNDSIPINIRIEGNESGLKSYKYIITDSPDPILKIELSVEAKIKKVKEKLASSSLQKVNYSPKPTDSTVTIPSANNDGVAEQVFSQENLGVTGYFPLEWYLLNVDTTGVTLVSGEAAKYNRVCFKGWNGYANCLYYLDRIASTLFSNNDKDAVAHCLRLTDIREAAKTVNSWNDSDWQTNFVNKATEKTLDSRCWVNFYGYCSRYPSLYGTSSSTVDINNTMYDENTGGTGIPMRTCVGVDAKNLYVNGTFFSYYNNAIEDKGLSNQLDKLSYFGDTGIAEELFSGNCCIATRYIKFRPNGSNIPLNECDYGIRQLVNGVLGASVLADSSSLTHSSGSTPAQYQNYNVTNINYYTIRAVVKVPWKNVSVAEDGTVSII